MRAHSALLFSLQLPHTFDNFMRRRQTVYHIVDGLPEEVSKRARALLEGWGLPLNDRHVHLAPLVGGANNINVVVSASDKRYVLKMRPAPGATMTTALCEAVAAQQAAAALGIAPTVVASTSDGDFLSEFIEGTTLRPDVFRSTDCLPEVVRALRAVHTVKPIARRFDILGDTEVFLAEAASLGAELPDNFGALRKIADRFQRALDASGAPVTFLHGDLVPQNMIMTPAGVKFIDFDYCGTAMTAADLAIVASQAELDAAGTERLLRLYDPGLDDSQRARITGIQFINTLREISWACAAQHKIAESTVLFGDWSYGYHLRINQELAERILQAHSVDDLEKAMAEVRPQALF